MVSKETYKCKNCKDPFSARVADRKRGWALYCSKSCKAIAQTKRTGRGKPIYASYNLYDYDGINDIEEGWDGHKGAF